MANPLTRNHVVMNTHKEETITCGAGNGYTILAKSLANLALTVGMAATTDPRTGSVVGAIMSEFGLQSKAKDEDEMGTWGLGHARMRLPAWSCRSGYAQRVYSWFSGQPPSVFALFSAAIHSVTRFLADFGLWFGVTGWYTA